MAILIAEIAQILNELSISESDNDIIKSLAEIIVDFDLTGEEK